MSVLIKNMRMPKNCLDCVLNSGERCEATKNYCLYRARPTHCPLVEIPPHGRLIDADVAEVIVTDEKDEVGGFLDGILYAADWIANQPTIIEAEETE